MKAQGMVAASHGARIAPVVFLLACAPATSDSGGAKNEEITLARSSLTAADVQPFTGWVDWTTQPFFGTRGTYLADVTGATSLVPDGRADLITVNDTDILVRPSVGKSPFASAQTWSTTAFLGNWTNPALCGLRTGCVNFFADVTGDKRADAIIITNTNVKVRKASSTQAVFNAEQSWLSATPLAGTKGTFFADVTGDGKADMVVVNDNAVVQRSSNGNGFGASATQNVAAWGTRSTALADVTGDGRADLIAINDADIKVRPALSSGQFADPAETWSDGNFADNLWKLVADVTGDGLADVVAFKVDGIYMRRSGRWFFGREERMSDQTIGPDTNPVLADVGSPDLGSTPRAADGRADLVQLAILGSHNQVVRLRQDRRVPLRIVQLVNDCASARNDTAVQAAIDDANFSFGDTGVQFDARVVGNNTECPGFTKSHVVVSPTLADVRQATSASQAELAKAKDPFNAACNMGYADFATQPEGSQVWWVAARCNLPGELLIYVTVSGSSYTNDPSDGKLVMLDPSDGFNVLSNRMAHELGHYFGLPHSFDLGYGQITLVDPATGQGSPLAAYWDLVFSGSQFFRSRAAASAYESSLTSISVSNQKGWFCLGTTPLTTCPFSPAPKAAVGIPLGGSSSNIAYTYFPNPIPGLFFDERLKGIAPRIPGNGPGIDSMSFSYNPSDPPNLKRRFSLSQIEIIQNNLRDDVLTKYLDASGRVIYGDRPRLGIDGLATQLRYFTTPGAATAGRGTVATNGWNTWVIGTNGFDSNGNQIYEWDGRLRVWQARSGGARFIAMSSGSSLPWAITGGIPGPVKRWNGSSFQNLSGDPSAQACARSLAIGEHSSGQSAWSIGCEGPNWDGNFKIERYRESTGAGWQKTAGPGEGWGVQIAADSQGAPWVVTQFAGGQQTTIYRGELASDGTLTGWTQFAPPSGVKPVHLTGGARRDGAVSLPINFIGDNNRIYVFNPNSASWTDNGFVPTNMSAAGGALPYLWMVNGASGQISYAR